MPDRLRSSDTYFSRMLAQTHTYVHVSIHAYVHRHTQTYMYRYWNKHTTTKTREPAYNIIVYFFRNWKH